VVWRLRKAGEAGGIVVVWDVVGKCGGIGIGGGQVLEGGLGLVGAGLVGAVVLRF